MCWPTQLDQPRSEWPQPLPRREVLLKVTYDGLIPVQAQEVQAGDRIIQVTVPTGQNFNMPEGVQVSQYLVATDAAGAPQPWFDAQCPYPQCQALWAICKPPQADRGTNTLVVRIPRIEHQPPDVRLDRLSDPDPHAITYEALRYMLQGKQPGRLALSEDFEQRLRKHAICQRQTMFGTLEKPARPLALLGWPVCYDQPFTGPLP